MAQNDEDLDLKHFCLTSQNDNASGRESEAFLGRQNKIQNSNLESYDLLTYAHPNFMILWV